MGKGLLIVLTGNGKGKTTSALGQTFRALGQGFRVCFIQFIKGSRGCGEQVSAAQHSELLDFHVLGRGLTWRSDDLNKDIAMARDAWEFAKTVISAGKFHMVVLDEITYLIKHGMVDETEIVDVLQNRPDHLHIVATGRGAPVSLRDAADLVTVMNPEKHHYQQGIKAQKGIEF